MHILERIQTEMAAVRRRLRQSRGALFIAVLTLAAAIGTNLAVLGLVSRALLTPPAGLSDAAQLFSVAFEVTRPDGRELRLATTSWPAFRQIERDAAGVAGAAAWQRGPGGVVVDGEQRPAETLLVSDGYFDVLGAGPARGRGLRRDERDPVVVLGHRFWLSAFGGALDVLGREVVLSGKRFQVAGVMPPGFTGHASTVVDAWFPIEQALADSPGWNLPLRNVVSVFVRVDLAQQAAVPSRIATLVGRRAVLTPLSGADIPEQDRRIALWLAAVAALVLLIGLANAGTLLAVRAARHQRESSIRIALGATRGRLLAQLAGESAALGLTAAGVSLVLAVLLDGLVRGSLLPGLLPARAGDPLLMGAALLSGVLASLVAFAAGIADVRASVWTGALRTQPRPSLRIQRALLTVQIAASVLLLAGAAMFGRSLHHLKSQDLGIEMDGLLVVDFEQGPGSVDGQDELFRAALDPVRRLPGVTGATVYQSLPFSGFHVPPIAVPGWPEPPSAGQQLPFLLAATPEFMEIMGIRIVEGRGFTAADERAAPVVIVNESMARGVWPGESAVGKCIRIGFDPDFDPFSESGPPVPSTALPCRHVIGVAHDTRQRSIVPTGNETALMQYYVPITQVPPPPMAAGAGPQVNGLLVRTTADPTTVALTLRRIVSAGRDDLPFVRIRPYTALFARQLRPWQLGTTLFAVFSGLAAAIAAVGLYAAFAHAVAVRRRELAIRLAIGATPARLRRMVLRDAAVLTLAGAAGGTAGAVFAGRAIGAVLYGIQGTDTVALGGATTFMLVVALLATAIPAIAAARSDPNALLRAE